jgi:hypothetical protein
MGGDTMTADRKTPDFSAHSEFSGMPISLLELSSDDIVS